MAPRPLTALEWIRTWNWFHPEDPRPFPPRGASEPVSPFVDALDVLLALYILQARLDDA